MDEFKHALGSEAKDTITGYTGIIIGRTEWFHGCRRYVVQVQKLSEAGIPIEAEPFDEGALEILKPATLKAAKFKYELGSEASDSVTGYKGIIVGRTEWLHNTPRYEIQAPMKKDGEIPKRYCIPEAAVKVHVAAEKHVMKKTGGPGPTPSRPSSTSR